MLFAANVIAMMCRLKVEKCVKLQVWPTDPWPDLTQSKLLTQSGAAAYFEKRYGHWRVRVGGARTGACLATRFNTDIRQGRSTVVW